MGQRVNATRFKRLQEFIAVLDRHRGEFMSSLAEEVSDIQFTRRSALHTDRCPIELTAFGNAK